MAHINATLRIERGNVESRIIGPVPVDLLDRKLNPHLASLRGQVSDKPSGALSLVFDPLKRTVLNGALGKVKRLLRDSGYRFRIVDVRSVPRTETGWSLVPGLQLRDYQEEVVSEAMERGGGMISCGTGAGKTLLAAACIARAGLPTLVLTFTRALLWQSQRRFREYLGVEPGIIGDGEFRPGRLTVALAQSLSDKDLMTWSLGTLVIDEGHHAAASTALGIIKRVNPSFMLLLSAVPFRAGSDQCVLNALTGGTLTGEKFSSRYLVEHGWACPAEVRIETINIRGRMMERPYSDLYRDFIVANQERNRRIASIVCRESGAGRSVLILVDHVQHGDLIMQLLPEAVFVHGNTPKRSLKRILADFAEGRIPCLMSTAGLLMEGLDICGIETLVMAGGQRSRSKIIQSIGRGMRKRPGQDNRKTRFFYYDFFDNDESGVLRSHSRQRLAVLMEQGFHVPPVHTPAPEDREREDLDPIPATWTHIPQTKRFLLVDQDGEILERRECVKPVMVPRKFCKKCSVTMDDPYCMNHGGN